jgi:hypothetical protein
MFEHAALVVPCRLPGWMSAALIIWLQRSIGLSKISEQEQPVER